ncbi:hypothetical protein D3C87_1296060 [compost metagenome]
MGQVETAAKGVAKLVMQCHADVAEHGTAEPGAIQAVIAGIEIAWVVTDRFHSGGERPNAFLGHQRHHRISVLGIQTFGGVGNGVHTAGDGHVDGQADGKLRVVDHRFGQYARIFAGALEAVFGQAEYRRHLRSGISGRDRQDRQPGIHRDCLAEPCG